MTFYFDKYRQIQELVKKNNPNTKIVAVSKNQPIESILDAIDKGVRVFGENRVQEAKIKFEEIKENINDLELHLTGPLQRNKVREALKIFDTFHILDRKKLADEFFRYKELLINKKFFIQVNIGKEEKKSGIDPGDCNEFVKYCTTTLRLNVIGLMCIPPYKDNPVKYFNQLKSLSIESGIKELSMGMSQDFEEAIKVGATYIRVGTLLFGKRKM